MGVTSGTDLPQLLTNHTLATVTRKESFHAPASNCSNKQRWSKAQEIFWKTLFTAKKKRKKFYFLSHIFERCQKFKITIISPVPKSAQFIEGEGSYSSLREDQRVACESLTLHACRCAGGHLHNL